MKYEDGVPVKDKDEPADLLQGGTVCLFILGVVVISIAVALIISI